MIILSIKGARQFVSKDDIDRLNDMNLVLQIYFKQ